jgi:CheY-like chemotaxis protein
MTAPIHTPLFSAPIPNPVKKKRVLLVDTSRRTRDLRAEMMRKLGMEVDCAADISEARSWWRADLYSLVLIDVGNEPRRRDEFCDDIRSANPPQQFAFLVGKPGYLADAPNAEAGPTNGTRIPQNGDWRKTPAVEIPEGQRQRWGILEACQRISAVRAAFHAKSQAMQDIPSPPRDLERQRSNRFLGPETPPEAPQEYNPWKGF